MLGTILFATIAAIGNAVFAFGQKRATGIDNPLFYIILSVTFCILFTAIAVPLAGKCDYLNLIKNNWLWACISGIGLFITYIGFYLLFSRYGTSSYVLYAVISIFTTAVLVGILIFKESFNAYQWGSLVLSIIAIILYFIGK